MKTRLGVMALCLVVGSASAGAAFAASDEPDNTGRNERDREGGTVTPIDQGNSEGDLQITSAIRKAVVDQDDFSTNARNVKIITRDGVVTLRGPVNSLDEKNRIASIAERAPGVRRVDNQIEIAKKD
jgi:osmotically-inducible protein OsmY